MGWPGVQAIGADSVVTARCSLSADSRESPAGPSKADILGANFEAVHLIIKNLESIKKKKFSVIPPPSDNCYVSLSSFFSPVDFSFVGREPTGRAV